MKYIIIFLWISSSFQYCEKYHNTNIGNRNNNKIYQSNPNNLTKSFKKFKSNINNIFYKTFDLLSSDIYNKYNEYFKNIIESNFITTSNYSFIKININNTNDDSYDSFSSELFCRFSAFNKLKKDEGQFKDDDSDDENVNSEIPVASKILLEINNIIGYRFQQYNNEKNIIIYPFGFSLLLNYFLSIRFFIGTIVPFIVLYLIIAVFTFKILMFYCYWKFLLIPLMNKLNMMNYFSEELKISYELNGLFFLKLITNDSAQNNRELKSPRLINFSKNYSFGIGFEINFNFHKLYFNFKNFISNIIENKDQDNNVKNNKISGSEKQIIMNKKAFKNFSIYNGNYFIDHLFGIKFQIHLGQDYYKYYEIKIIFTFANTTDILLSLFSRYNFNKYSKQGNIFKAAQVLTHGLQSISID